MIILDTAEYAEIFRNARRGILKGAPDDLYPQMRDYVAQAKQDIDRHIGHTDADQYRDEFTRRKNLAQSVTDARIRTMLLKAETVDYKDLTNEERVLVRRIRDILEAFRKERGIA